jgi:hypothetical protein
MYAATSGEGPKEGSNGRSNCEVLLIKGIFRRRHARDAHFSLDCPTRSNTLYLYREGAARNTSIAIVIFRVWKMPMGNTAVATR